MNQILANEKDDRKFDDLAWKIYVNQIIRYWEQGLLSNEEFADKIIALRNQFKKTKEA